MAMELLVQAAELLQAAMELNQASEIYEEAVEAAKAAAEDLASKWEGAAKDAFVRHQENAYNWHKQILVVVREMVSTIRKAVELYKQMEATVKGIMQG